MDTSNVQEKTAEGAWFHRARAMSLEEKSEFSLAVYELASWFGGQIRSCPETYVKAESFTR